MPPAKQKPSKRRAISPHDSIDSGSTCKPIPVRDGEQPRRAQRRRLSTVASISSAGVRPRVDVDLHLDALETRTPDLFKGSCFVLEEDIWDPGAMSQVKRNIEVSALWSLYPGICVYWSIDGRSRLFTRSHQG
jgi:hypothetical protein